MKFVIRLGSSELCRHPPSCLLIVFVYSRKLLERPVAVTAGYLGHRLATDNYTKYEYSRGKHMTHQVNKVMLSLTCNSQIEHTLYPGYNRYT